MDKFTKEQDEMLINLVQCNSVLYDTSEKDFKNNVLKHRVWENISDTMDIPVSDIKKRWKHLRDHYNKKKKAEQGTGQARGQSNWEYMSQLSFLSQVPCQRSTFTNVERNNETVNEGSEEADQNIEFSQNQVTENSFKISHNDDLMSQHTNNNNCHSPSVSGTPTSSREKKRKTGKSPLLSILEKRQNERAAFFAQLSQQEPKTPIKKFFDSMADIVSQFPPHLVAEARMKVCQVVTDIELKMHSHQQSPEMTPMPLSSPEDSTNTTLSWTQL